MCCTKKTIRAVQYMQCMQWTLAGINNSALYRQNIVHNRGLHCIVQWIAVHCTEDNSVLYMYKC